MMDGTQVEAGNCSVEPVFEWGAFDDKHKSKFESSQRIDRDSTPGQNVLIGGFAGLLVGVGILFILTMLYGKSMGLAPVDCLLASCTLTLLLSQPMGIAGMTAGAIIGALTGAMVHHNRHSRPL